MVAALISCLSLTVGLKEAKQLGNACVLYRVNKCIFLLSAGDLLLDKKRSITNLCTLRLRSLKPKDFLHGGDAYEHGQQLCTGLGPWGSCRPARGGPPG